MSRNCSSDERIDWWTSFRESWRFSEDPAARSRPGSARDAGVETSTPGKGLRREPPHGVNSRRIAVLASRFFCLLFHRRDNSLHVATRGSVNALPF